jgi:hypothetical protein
MRKLIASLVLLVLLAVLVSVTTGEGPAEPMRGRSSFAVFREDWEGGGWPGWTHTDRSGGPSEFHVSTYYAYDDGTPPNYSYWCGTFDYDADGGYGDGWLEYLEVPPIDLSGVTNPRLRFRYRQDIREHAQDFDATVVEVKHLGEYRELITYTGNSGGWQLQPPLNPEPFDNLLEIRFRFLSDMPGSDESGYDSVAGAFHVDEIRVWQFAGPEYFFDDVEDGVGLCTPIDVVPTGVTLQTVETVCRANSDPTTTSWCAAGDTSCIPPYVFASSVTPPIHVEEATQCTVFAKINLCMPADAGPGDKFGFEVSTDGGMTWHYVRGLLSWGAATPGECDDFWDTLEEGENLSGHLPATSLLLRWTMFTDDDGCGPDASGAGGMFIDDIEVRVDTLVTSIEEGASWGRIKSMYRD